MRHGNKVNALGRKAAHRHALLRNLAIALIEHKKITTTLAKARELRKYVEPLITKSKNDTTHNRRVVFSYLQNKEAIKELFGVVRDKVGERPGGYARIIKLGFRKGGDAAEIAMIELVDFNEIYQAGDTTSKSAASKRRGRRGGKGKASTGTGDDTTTPLVTTAGSDAADGSDGGDSSDGGGTD